MAVFSGEASIGLIRSEGKERRLLWVVGVSKFVPRPEDNDRIVPMVVFHYKTPEEGRVIHIIPIFDGRPPVNISIPGHCEDVLSPDILPQRPELYGRLPQKS